MKKIIWDKPICSFCKCKIEEGTINQHKNRKCLDEDFWLEKFKKDFPEDHIDLDYDGVYQ